MNIHILSSFFFHPWTKYLPYLQSIASNQFLWTICDITSSCRWSRGWSGCSSIYVIYAAFCRCSFPCILRLVAVLHFQKWFSSCHSTLDLSVLCLFTRTSSPLTELFFQLLEVTSVHSPSKVRIRRWCFTIWLWPEWRSGLVVLCCGDIPELVLPYWSWLRFPCLPA